MNEGHWGYERHEAQRIGDDLRIMGHRKHLDISEWLEVAAWEGLA